MALATLDSLARGLDYTDIMKRFCDWKLYAANMFWKAIHRTNSLQ